MRNWMYAALPAIFVAQTLLVGYGIVAEHPPPMANLPLFPVQLAEWNKVADVAVSPAIVGQLGADQMLERIYRAPASFRNLDFLVAWFQSQRGGRTQPHSPEVCLPGSGWVPEEVGVIPISTDSGQIRVNRYIVASRLGRRAVVLYWYQTPHRVLAGESEAKLWLIADAFRYHRTDTSLVRIFVWTVKGREREDTAAAVDFARRSYPVLHRLFPL